MRLVLIALGAAVLTACESDADKLNRLEMEASMASLDVLAATRSADSIAIAVIDSMIAAGDVNVFVQDTTLPLPEKVRFARRMRENQMESLDDKLLWLVSDGLRPDLKEAVDSVYRARDRRTLSERELTLFMNGR